MRMFTLSLALSIVLLALLGCGSKQKGPPREATYPIIGVITVDGEPVEQIRVTCHPVGAGTLPTASSAYSTADGGFSIGTYEAGDGAPAGEYKLTFMWGAINLMSGRYDGPDKLKGRYSKVETSEFSVTVEDGKENDMCLIALTTK
ncbi:MAG: hypothetical protein GY903_22085 [Fuerstiella sp.]|nr:hypothetical protein [Fuerstiella sp.]MCP4857182.1 hypothetical protein [Fuerstiella sp.]